MIIGLRCDITNIDRICKSFKYIDHLMNRICGTEEIAEISRRQFQTEQEKACLLAKYFAGKEAFAKALGTGFRNGIFLKDVQILHNPLGKPFLQISGTAALKLAELSPKTQLHISLSDDFPFAQAVVVIEG